MGSALSAVDLVVRRPVGRTGITTFPDLQGREEA